MPWPFLYINLFLQNKNVQVTDTHVNVQRLVSIVKMATVLKEYITEEQTSDVLSLWPK
jgi:hypothetical protein